MIANMPGRPSPIVSTSSSLSDDLHDDTSIGYNSTSSIDSLAGEFCDNINTMQIPDADLSVHIHEQASPASQEPSEDTNSVDNVVDQDFVDGPTESSDPFEENHITEVGSTEDEIGEKWNPSLYMLQSQAPKPICVKCNKEWNSRPSQYGPEHHGVIDKNRAAELIGTQDGAYLVRNTPKGASILTFMLDQRLYNFRLLYQDDQFSVGETRFDSLEDLVQDGLITLYLQKHNVAQVMEEGRNDTILRKTKEKARRLRRQDGRRVRGLKGREAWRHSSSSPSRNSMGSLDVQPSSSKGNSPSPNLSRSPSPSPILETSNSVQSSLGSILGDSSQMRPISSPESSPSPVHTTEQRKSLSPDVSNLILDLNVEESRSAPQTPIFPPDHQLVLVPATPDDNQLTSLDFESNTQRKSAPTIHGDALHQKRSLGVNHTPLTARRVQSASSIQKGGKSTAERRTAIINALRSAVQEDRMHTRSDPQLKKSATLGATSNKSQYRRPERSNTCSAVASTLEKLAEYSNKGPSTLSRSSLAALARHTTGPRSPYTKAHNFDMHSYIAPTWCEICHNFLWGLKQQGMQCKDCGMDIHKQCLPLAIQLQCYPTKAFVKRVYGVDLTTLVKLEGGLVPKIVSDCINELESRGMTSRGIYRVSGHNTEILELKENYDHGEKIDFSQYEDENIITGAVKLYLRELPIPLITFDAYKNIIRATAAIPDPDNKETDWQPLINALLHLPKAHYNTLKHLIRHLNNVDSLSEDNKMTARNLAVVFAPTLMRSPSEDSTLLIKDLPLQKTFVEYLITYHEILFKS